VGQRVCEGIFPEYDKSLAGQEIIMSPLSIIISILGIGLLAAAHEIGHFLVARKLGIKVEELSVFVGPSLIHWKRNGVEYHIRLIPFGAYVRFPGMEDEDGGITNPDSYLNQPRWKRLIVALAGPITNIILGIIIFAVVFASFGFLSTNLDTLTAGTQIAGTNAVENDTIISLNGKRILTDADLGYYYSTVPDTEPMVLTLQSHETGNEYSVTLNPTIESRYILGISVVSKSELDKNNGWEIVEVDPTQNGGIPVLKKGDSLLAVNGVSVTDSSYADIIPGNTDNKVAVTIVRDGVKQDVTMTATVYDAANPRGIFVKPGSGIGDLLKHSVLYSASVIVVSIDGLKSVAQGKIKAQDAIAGPVGIATIVSDVVDAPTTDNSMKVEYLGTLAGLISVGLAFSNLLPLPGLDGNVMVLVVIEMIRGKKISLKTERVINAVGFVVLISLVIFALSSDIMRLVG